MSFVNVTKANITTGATVYTGTTTTLTGGSGSKKALLFGLNYNGTINQLNGCIRDVQNLNTYLSSLGFSVEMYTDNTTQKPTRSVMLAKYNAFLASLGPNDTGVIWYSGHGTMASGNRNAWVPLDFSTAGFLPEDQLRGPLANVPAGAYVFIGSDSCYSGTMFNLKYDVEPAGSVASVSARALQRQQKTGNAAQFKWPDGRVVTIENQSIVASILEKSGLANVTNNSSAIATTEESKVVNVPVNEEVPLDLGSVARATMVQNFNLYNNINWSTLRSNVVFLSGCRDSQTSADAYIDSTVQGAMTWSFLRTLRSNSQISGGMSLGLLQNGMRSALQGRFSQVPQLSFGLTISPFTKVSAFKLV